MKRAIADRRSRRGKTNHATAKTRREIAKMEPEIAKVSQAGTKQDTRKAKTHRATAKTESRSPKMRHACPETGHGEAKRRREGVTWLHGCLVTSVAGGAVVGEWGRGGGWGGSAGVNLNPAVEPELRY